MNELYPRNRGLLMAAMLAGVMGIDPLNPRAKPRKTSGVKVSQKEKSRRAMAKASRRRNRK